MMKWFAFAALCFPPGLLARDPRILLDAPTIQRLQDQARQGTAEWKALEKQCDAYLKGTIYPPRTARGRYDFWAEEYKWANSADPNIGIGYQGSGGGNINGYWDAMLNLGVCYHTVKGVDPGRAAQYSGKAVELIDLMSVRPGVIALPGGELRYISDTSHVAGSAWTEGAQIQTAAAANAKQLSIGGLKSGGSVEPGDAFVVGKNIFIAKARVIASDAGVAEVPLGSVHPYAALASAESAPAGGIPAGTPVTTPLIVTSYYHGITAPVRVSISGVEGNVAANGDWQATVFDTHRLQITGAVGRSLQTNLIWDAMYNMGYGARFYGAALAIGYDWFYDALPPSVRAGTAAAIVRWIRGPERFGYGLAHPAGNYFAGFYVAKLFGALALEGDLPEGAEMYDEWFKQYYAGPNGVQTYFKTYLVDTGHPDGPNYGWFATQNLLWAALALKTGKGVDVFRSPDTGFTWPEGAAKWILHHTLPNRLTHNTRQKQFGGDDPSRISGSAVTTLNGYLYQAGSKFSPYFNDFAKDVLQTLQRSNQRPSTPKAQWNDFLFAVPAEPSLPYTKLARSFYSAGSGEMAMRSDWSREAVWASFIAGPNVHSMEGGKDIRDRGGLAIARGSIPFLVNATNELYRYNNTSDLIFADAHTISEETPGIQNIFFVNSGGRWLQGTYGPGGISPAWRKNDSHVARQEDGGTYVYARGENLEDNYYPIGYPPVSPQSANKPVRSWTREVLYLRPGVFLVYDKTMIAVAGQDQYMGWHFGRTPVKAGDPAAIERYDVQDKDVFKGAMFAVLPEGAATQVINLNGSSHAFRVEVRPPSQDATQRWLAAFDASASAGQVSAPQRLQGTTGLDGVWLAKLSTVVTFVRETSLRGSAGYTYPAEGTVRHLIAGLDAGGRYAVDLSTAGNVSITPARDSDGQALTASPAGVLMFTTTQGGLVALLASPAAVEVQCPGAEKVETHVELIASAGEVELGSVIADPWITVSAGEGVVPKGLSRAVSITGSCDEAESEEAAVTVSSSSGGVSNSPVVIPVILRSASVRPEAVTEVVPELTFVAQDGDKPPPRQTIQFSAPVVSAAADVPWIDASPANGLLDIGVVPASLAPGVHTGRVSAQLEGNSRAAVVVILSIAPSASVRIDPEVSQVRCSPEAPVQEVRIKVLADQAVILTAQSDSAWAVIAPPAKEHTREQEIVVTVDSTVLEPGTYTAKILITPAGSETPLTGTILLEVLGN